VAKEFIDLGPRNKGTFWEYCSAYSFLFTSLPRTEYEIQDFLGAAKGELNHHCHHKDTIREFKEVFKKEFASGMYDEAFFDDLRKVYDEPYQKVQERLLSSVPEEKTTLISLFKEVFLAFTRTHKPMLMALYTTFLQEEFEELVKKVVGTDEEFLEKINMLLHPNKATFVQKEEEALINFVQSLPVTDFGVALKGVLAQRKLDQLAKDYGWFHREYSKEPWTAQEYEKYILENENELRKKQLPSVVRQKIIGAQERFGQIYRQERELIEFARVLREFSFILDHSKEVVVHEFHLATELLERIAEKLGISKKDLLYLVYPEIVRLLKTEGKASEKLIKKRKEHRAVHLHNKKIKVAHGGEAQVLLDLIDYGDKEGEEIKGTSVCPGIVEGKVCIVKNEADKEKFISGDVLVTHDGSAELTYFLKHASAIVTNIGGMISHAAILAREMHIPCILGTKNATKILKDRDIVRVDANKGTVDILKQNH